MLLKILFIFVTIQFVSSAVNLTFIQRCSRNDSNLNGCIIQKGNIALKTILNGAFKLGTIKGKLNSTIDLTYDSYAYLSNDLKLIYSNIDFKKQEFQIGFNITKVVMSGNLTLNGTLENRKFLTRSNANFTYNEPSYLYNATYIMYTKNNTKYGRIHRSNMSTRYKSFNDAFYNVQFVTKITSDQYKVLDAAVDSNIESVITTGLLSKGNQIVTYVINIILGLIPLNQAFT